MKIGVHFPSNEIGTESSVMVDWARAATDLGFQHVACGEHVLGVDPTVRPDFADQWVMDADERPAYTYVDEWHEPFVTLGYLAASTPLPLSTCVLVSPLRRTAVLAKQAAQLDIVSGGRFRLGVGVGWNAGEFAAVGADFHRRGQIIEEQVELLRRFWTEPLVRFRGEFHDVEGAGIAPLPIQRPIPIWMGGFSPPAVRRAGRLADGWIAGNDPEQAGRLIDVVRTTAYRSGRDPAAIPFEGIADPGHRGGLRDLPPFVEAWRAVGAAYLTVELTALGRRGGEHVALLEEVAQLIDLGAN